MSNAQRHHRLTFAEVCAFVKKTAAIAALSGVLGGMLPPVEIFSIPKAIAAAGINKTIHYQGKVSAIGGAAIANGAYNMRFKIYDAATSGTQLWAETWSNGTQRVTMTGGLFSVALGTHVTMTGSVNFNTDSLYLQIEFDPGNDGTYEETFSPRRRFSSVPYAHNANTLDGVDSTQFVRKDQAEVMSGTLTIKPNNASRIGLDILSTAATAGTGGLRISTQGANHIVFGSGGGLYDVNLYRLRANVLKTDDSFYVTGTLSGSVIKADTLITSSGSVNIEGNLTGATINGFGLPGGGCSASNSKLIWNAGTGKFSCASELSGGAGTTGFTGAVIAVSDSRYVNVSGDTMTGALTINLTSGTLGLNVLQTASASSLSVAGANIIMTSSGKAIFNVMNRNADFQVKGVNNSALIFADASSNSVGIGTAAPQALLHIKNGSANTDLSIEDGGSNIRWNFSATTVSKLLLQDATNTTVPLTVEGGAATNSIYIMSSGNIGMGTSNADTKLEVIGTISGSVISTNTLRSSGTLVWEGAASGASLYVATSIRGSGLTDCDASTQKLQWDTTTGRFTCATDLTGGGGSSTGALQGYFDNRYVNTSGDTMTGALTINVTGGNNSTIGLRVINALSGSYIHAEKSLSSSGTLTWEGAASGATLYVATSIRGSGLTDCDLSTQKLQWDTTTGRFSCGTDLNTQWSNTGSIQNYLDNRYVNTSGDTMTGALTINLTSGYLGLKVLQTASGAFFYATKGIASSGTIVVESGTRFGSGALTVAQNAEFSTGAYIYASGGTVLALDSYTMNRGQYSHIRFGYRGNFDTNLYRAGSGILKTDGSLYVLSLLSGATIRGFGLTDCDASTQKLQWDATTGTFSCGTVSVGTNTGNVIAIGDQRYVKKQGDTMTGALTINLTSGYLGLKVLQTASGAFFYATKGIASSGTIVVESTSKFGSGALTVAQNAEFATGAYVYASGAAVLALTTYNPSHLSPHIVFGYRGNFDTSMWRSAPGTLTLSGNFLPGLDDRHDLGSSTKRWRDLWLGPDSLHIGSDGSDDSTISLDTADRALEMAINGVTMLTLQHEGGVELNQLPGCPSLATDSNGSISCGTNPLWTSTGALQNRFDGRYVNTSGDTMTGALTINLTSGTVGLEVIQTISGSTIFANNRLVSSGSLVTESGAIFDGGTLYVAAGSNRVGVGTATPEDKLQVVGGGILLDNAQGISFKTTGGTAAYVLSYDSGDNLVLRNNANSNTYIGVNAVGAGDVYFQTQGQNRMFIDQDGLVGIGTTAPDTALEVIGTVSGSNVYTIGSMTGRHLYAASTFGGAGLADCDTAGTSKLLWDASTKRFSCGTDVTGGGGSSTGALQGYFDNRYVNTSGDTMTGALTINLTSGTVGLEVIQTISGSTIFANNRLVSSGSLVTESGAIFDGGTLYVAAGSDRVGIGTTTPTDKLQIVGGNIRLDTSRNVSWGTSALGESLLSATPGDGGGFTFRAGGLGTSNQVFIMRSGTEVHMSINSDGTSPDSALEVIGTVSGSVLRAQNTLASSGTLVWEGAASGATLYVATSINGAGLVDCDIAGTSKLLWDSTTGRFSCGTDVSGGGGTSTGALQNYFDGRYVNTSGDTMTGALTINLTSGTVGLEVIQTISGSIIFANNRLVSSGSLVTESGAIFDGGTLYVAAGNNRVGVGTTTPKAALDVAGSMSGASLTLNGGSQTALRLFSTNGLMAEFDSNSGGAGYIQFEQAGTALGFIGHGDASTLFTAASSDSFNIRAENALHLGAGGNNLIMTLASGNVGIGTTSADTKLEVIGTISGSVLRAQNTLASSGTLVWEGAASGASLWVSTFDGAGLTDCDAAGQTVNWDATTKRFTCGTDESAGAGLDQNTGDARYVRKQGDTMTGTLVISTVATPRALKIIDNNFRGGILVEGSNAPALILKRTNSHTGAFLGLATHNGYYADESSTGDTVLRITGGQAFHIATTNRAGFTMTGNSVGIGTVRPGSRLSVSGSTIIGSNIGSASADPNVGLEIIGTASGRVLRAQNTLASSGTLVFEGAASGSSLYLGTSLEGAGLSDCDTAGTSKLMWDATTKRFSCGTDQNSGGSAWSNTGALQARFDGRYVNTFGDTMTGALTINITGGNNSTLGLNVLNTMSGAIVHAEKSLTSSGSISADGQIFADNSSDSATPGYSFEGDSDTGLQAFGANQMMLTAGSAQLLWLDGTTSQVRMAQTRDASLPALVFGLDSDTGLFQAAADQLNFAAAGSERFRVDSTGIKIFGTASGRVVRADNTLASSGTLVWEGAASGATLYVATSINGAGLVDCDIAGTSKLLWDSTTGRFSCGTDQSGGGAWSNTGALQARFDGRYVNTFGDTMTGALTINVTGGNNSTLGLNVLNTISGSVIRAQKTLASSGTLVWEGAASGSSLMVAGGNISMAADGMTIFNVSNKDVDFSIDGDAKNELFYVDATTDTVGIGGISSPEASLHVYDNAGAVALIVGNTTAAQQMRFTENSISVFNTGDTAALLLNPTGGNVAINTTSASTALEVLGTISGSNVFATRSITGSNLYAASTFGGAGLADCDTAGTSKLLWDASTKRFSCGTDQTGGGGGSAWSNTGSLQAYFDSRWVNTAGDTMTGALTINITGGNNATVGLNVLNTISGSVIRAQKTLASSGTLVWEGVASGGILSVSRSASFAGSGLILSHSGFTIWNNNSRNVDFRMKGQTDASLFYLDSSANTIGIGTATPRGKLEVMGSISGSVINIARSATFAGSGLILSHSGITVFNENSRNVDFRIEGDTKDALFFLDASTDRIGIGSRVPKAFFDVYGTMSGMALNINGTMSGRNLFVTGTGAAWRTNPIIASDQQRGSVGIGTSRAAERLTVASGSVLVSPGGAPVSMGGLDTSIGVNDIAVQGKYTYLALDSVAGNDFRIVDNSLATTPVTLSGAELGGNVRAVAVAGKYAYVGLASNGSHPEIIVYDVSNPSGIVRLGGVELARNVHDLQVVNGLLYVTMSNDFSNGEFAIYDVSNPFSIQRIWIMPSAVSSNLNTVYVNGRYAYLGYASATGNDFRIYDISNPEAPISRGGIDLSTGVQSIQVVGKYAYVGLDANGSTDFRVYDVSNPNATPVLVGGIETNANVTSVQVGNRHAYLGLASVAGTDFRIIDVNNPAAPTTVGGVDLSIGVNRVVVAGKTAYVGLATAAGNDYRVFDLNGIDAPAAIIGVLSTTNLSVFDNATIGNTLTVGNSLTVGLGGIYSQGTINIITGSGGNSMTGMIIRSRGKSGALLALDSYTNTGAKAPHIAFGYRGNFDTYISRSGTGIVVKAETTNTSINLFRVMSNATNVNNTRFRVQGDGNAYADGFFNGGGADYAEYFYTSTPNLVQGELVCIDITKENTVKRCASAADTNVMGIVSSPEQAAFIGNKFKQLDGLPVPGTVLVGLIGQLSTKAMVEGSGGTIRPGDELTPASKPGYARKAVAGEPTVGVALSGLSKGEGMIDVLIARKNGSLSASAVSDRVLETVKSLKIEDELKLSLQKTIDELTEAGSFTEPVAIEVEKQLQALRIEDINAKLNTLSAQLLSLSGSMAQAHQSSAASSVSSVSSAPATFDGTVSTLHVSDLLTVSGSLVALGDITGDSLAVNGMLTAGGDARIGGDLHIEGALVARTIFAPGGVTVDGDLAINGALRFGSGASMAIGDLLVEDALRVVGDITIEGLAMFLKDVTIKGTLTISNRQAGFAVVKANQTRVVVEFGSGGFVSAPVVTATSNDFVETAWRIRPVTQTGFVLEFAQPLAHDVTFSWLAMLTDGALTHAMDENGLPITLSGGSLQGQGIAFPVDGYGVPVSSSPLWNACIRNQTPLDASGQPYNCNRYHESTTWTHPDLMVIFTWNTSVTPPLLKLPEGYYVQVTGDAEIQQSAQTSSASSTSSVSTSAASESSEASSEQSSQASSQGVSEASSTSSASSEQPASSEASSASSEAMSSATSSETIVNPEPEPEAPSEPAPEEPATSEPPNGDEPAA